MLRLVRLTIETNALCGMFAPNYSIMDVRLTCIWATVAIASIVLYVAFPVGWILTCVIMSLLTFCIPRNTEWHILRVHVRFVLLHHLLSPLMWAKRWNHWENVKIDVFECHCMVQILTGVPDTPTRSWWASIIAYTSVTAWPWIPINSTSLVIRQWLHSTSLQLGHIPTQAQQVIAIC